MRAEPEIDIKQIKQKVLNWQNLDIPISELPFDSLIFSLLPASVSSWPSNDSVAKEVLRLKPEEMIN